MKKIYSLALIGLASLAFGQISLTAAGTAVTENFDGMGTTLPTGFSAYRASGTGTVGQSLSPVVDNGSANSGAIYSVGTSSAADRALGSIASGSTVPSYGAQISNNTGVVMTGLVISFTEEQWRTGSNATVNEVVTFTYSTDAASLNDAAATWTPISAGDLTEILTTSTNAAAVDGNLAANQLAKSFTISGLTVANGNSVWIRWTDEDNSGADCMLAVDNLSLTAQTSGSLAVSDLKKVTPNFIKNTLVKNNEITFGADVKDIKIYTLSGAVVKTGAVQKGSTLNVAELAKGNYIVTGILNNEPVSQKIFKD
ncbi:T9SS type A sorting domain-containing protein [Chryseobacterium sp.]|uniref:T9SS type A sorting domain-containing protein n=1 Tax=Chryseobacterium sp. TaxID=1871047 RepID=UPI0028A008D1|nr:T9SS type A sorting domain-containing protein [Chryseobacterium sp.]